MKVYIDFPQSHPLFDKITRFFRKKGWQIASDPFDCDYVVQISSEGIPTEPERLIVVTQDLGQHAGDILECALCCALLIELFSERCFLPNGRETTWKHFELEYAVTLDSVL